MAGADPKKLHALLKRLVHEAKAQDEGALGFDAGVESSDRFDPGVHELVLGLLMHHTTLANAQACQRRLRAGFVDVNELRAASAKDIAITMGERPGSQRDDRALRIHAMLTDLFERDGDLSLDLVRSKKPAEQREALLSLDGVTPFAALRVLGLHLGQGVVAIDDRALHALQEQGIVPAKASELQAGQQIATIAKQVEPTLGIGHLHRLFRELGERSHVPASMTPKAAPSKPGLAKRATPEASARLAAKGPVVKSPATKNPVVKKPKPAPRKAT
jgi:endonuclease III